MARPAVGVDPAVVPRRGPAHADWQDEPRVYTSPLARDLPPGLRFPHLFAVDHDDERITVWPEDVDDTGPWDTARYQRTARQLGRLAGHWRSCSSARSPLPTCRPRR
jgi:hypothetical protein